MILSLLGTGRYVSAKFLSLSLSQGAQSEKMMDKVTIEASLRVTDQGGKASRKTNKQAYLP